MKEKLTIICLLFLLYSCNLFRTTTNETNQKNDIKTETDISKKADEKIDLIKDSSANTNTKIDHYATKEQIDKMIAEWSENYTVYDTSKPVDKTTGKPPVQSERIINYKSDKQNNNTQKVNSTVDKQEINNLKVDSSKQLKTNSDSIAKLTDKSETDTSNKEGATNWKLWFGLGIASVIAIYLAIRYGKNLILPRLP
jgi:hypothetical protein